MVKHHPLKNTTNKYPIVRGVLVASAWNQNGEVTRISLQTNTEEEFLIEKNKHGKTLFQFLNNEIEAEGSLRDRLDGKKLISVKSYSVLKS